jgi:hypothetical protein
VSIGTVWELPIVRMRWKLWTAYVGGPTKRCAMRYRVVCLQSSSTGLRAYRSDGAPHRVILIFAQFIFP